jgi:cytochrome c553
MAGVIPLTASSGHWRVTSFVLDLAKRRSVDTHSFFVSPPSLTDPATIARGAAHYESGCATCHGSPAAPRPAIVMGMTPHPPFLPERIRRWLPRELFYIVKHGIKFTGMPAWPVDNRDDEVWAVVSFLRQMPQLDARQYRRLSYGETTPEKGSVVERCARCHGLDGLGRDGAVFPRLAGQSAEFMRLALGAYARRQRYSGIMGPIAAALDERQIAASSEYFARLPAGAGASSAGAAARRGGEINARGIVRQDVPACARCHDPGGAEHNPAYPRLAGQFAEYLEMQLTLFANGRRGGSPYAEIMQTVAARLTPEQRREVAAFFATQPFQGRGDIRVSGSVR